jgi:DNA-binding transcriptional regulator YiaG
MTGAQFRTALDALGLSPGAFADRLGLHRATVFRWLEKGPPKYAELILSLLSERQALAKRLLRDS